MPKEFSAGAVVFSMDGKPLYLLLHYESGHWDFIKGNVEQGESEQETARREAAEEAGIDELEFIPAFEERISYFYKREGKTVHKEVVFLLAKTETKDIRLSFEHVGFEWLHFKEAVDRLTFRNAKQVLEKANGFLVEQ